MSSLPASPPIVPTALAITQTFAPRYPGAIPSPSTTTDDRDLDHRSQHVVRFRDFVSGVTSTLSTTNPAVQLVARGIYDRATNTFTATASTSRYKLIPIMGMRRLRHGWAGALMAGCVAGAVPAQAAGEAPPSAHRGAGRGARRRLRSGASARLPRVVRAAARAAWRTSACCRVIEELKVPIDCIAGTSMGAVVGGLYASGMSAAQIESTMRSVNWQEAFRDAPPRRDLNFRRKQDDRNFLVRLPLGLKHYHVLLPKGFIQGQTLQETLRQLTLPFSNTHELR